MAGRRGSSPKGLRKAEGAGVSCGREMAALTVAEAVERIAEELSLDEGARRPKAVASAALLQLALPQVEGEGLKSQLDRILQELDIPSGWEPSGNTDTVRSGARLCLLAIGGWDRQFQRLQRVDALEWSATGCPSPAWRAMPSLMKPRCGGAACVAADGAVMVVGGMGESSAEVSGASVPTCSVLQRSLLLDGYAPDADSAADGGRGVAYAAANERRALWRPGRSSM